VGSESKFSCFRARAVRMMLTNTRIASADCDNLIDEVFPAEALITLEAAMKGGVKYPELRKLVASWLNAENRRVHDPTAFVTSCIEIVFAKIQREHDPSVLNERLVIHYLLLECLGRVPNVRQGVTRKRFNEDVVRGRISCERGRAQAGKLIHSCITKCNAVPSRAVVRLIETFSLDFEDLCFSTPCAAKTAISSYTQLLLDDGKLSSALSIIMHFNLDEFASIDTLIVFARGKEYSLAQEFVQCLDSDTRRSWIEFCMVEGDNEHSALRYAHRAVVAFKLEAEYPEVRIKYFQSTIRRMIFKGQFEAALKHAGAEFELQTTVIETLAEIGELAYAHEFALRCGLDFWCDPAQLENLVARRRLMYFQLPEELCVVFVDDERTLLEAAEKFLFNQDVIGLDTEWGASVGEDSDKADTGNVATLQLASRAGVVIVDIPKIIDTCPDALERTVGVLFKSRSVLKLGFAVNEDLRRLAKGHEAFAVVNSCVDMQSLWKLGVSKARGSKQLMDTPWGSEEERSRYQPIGLSTLVAVVLGKPLDKAMRMSDWSKRPLMDNQITYAALDAWTLVEAHRMILHSHHDVYSTLISNVCKSHEL